MRHKITYNTATAPFVGFQTLCSIDTSAFENGHPFVLDITIHSSNGMNILENCSFVHFVSTYLKNSGISLINRQELKKVVQESGSGTAIQFIDSTDYQEVITGDIIEIQVDGSAGYNSSINCYVEVDYTVL